MACTPTELHLIHGVLLAKESPAFPTVDVSVYRAKPLSASRIRTHIVPRRALPMTSGYEFFWVDGRLYGQLAGRACSCRQRRRDRVGFVGFENFKTAQLHVDHGQRLKALRFEDLFVEPSLDLILFFGREFLVGVVDVAVELEQRDLEYTINIRMRSQ